MESRFPAANSPAVGRRPACALTTSSMRAFDWRVTLFTNGLAHAGRTCLDWKNCKSMARGKLSFTMDSERSSPSTPVKQVVTDPSLFDTVAALGDTRPRQDMPHPRRRIVDAPARRLPPQLQAVRVVVEADTDPDASYLDARELSERREAFGRGEFEFLRVRAEAEVLIEGTVQTLTSPGLSSIESDLDEKDVDQVMAEEWGALRGVLKAVGVPTKQLPLEVERGWVTRR